MFNIIYTLNTDFFFYTLLRYQSKNIQIVVLLRNHKIVRFQDFPVTEALKLRWMIQRQ